MAEYVFSNGVVRVKREVTLKSDRRPPHALGPAFIVLDAPPEREQKPGGQPEQELQGGEDDRHEEG